MEFEQGKIVCLRTTGELVMLLKDIKEGTFSGTFLVRRPLMTRNGIVHVEDNFRPFELETVEQHLRHEANEMFLKSQIQEELQERLEQASDKKKAGNLLVN